MANPSCPECGPQGGHGRVTLAISVVDCSLCDGTAPRGIEEPAGGSFWARVVAAERAKEQAELRANHVSVGSAPIGHDDLRDEHLRAALVDALVAYARPAAAPDGTIRWRLEPEQPVSAGTLGQYRAFLQTHSARYLAGKVRDYLPPGPAQDTAREVLGCDS